MIFEWFIPFNSPAMRWTVQGIFIAGALHIVASAIDAGVMPTGADIFMATPGILFLARWLWMTVRFCRTCVRYVQNRVSR